MAINKNIADIPLTLPIGGQWVEGEGAEIRSIYPADGSLNGRLATASIAQADQAFSKARETVEKANWASLKPHIRADYLHKAAALILERQEKLAILQSLENGKTLRESKGQVTSAAGIVRYFAALCETLQEEISPARGNYVTCVIQEPLGIVVALTPWNSPLTMGAQKIAPALAAGNAVILKPSELTSLVSIELARCFLDAGLPDGVLSVVPGGADIGRLVVDHIETDMISFTGGTETGRKIAKSAAARFIPTILELGGKSPNIVFADADLDAATSGVVSAIFGSGGQSCVAGSRLFVEQSIYQDFMDLVIQKAKKLELGDPFDTTSTIGPMASFAQRDRVEKYVKQATEQGGRILLGGERLHGGAFEKGAYYPPTIIDELDHRAPIFQEEIFGGVLAAMPFRNLDHVTYLANDTVYGLACGIWTGDQKKAWKLAKKMKAGSVWINCYKELSISAPFGGYKKSGLGREKGVPGLRAYQQLKSVYLGGFGEE